MRREKERKSFHEIVVLKHTSKGLAEKIKIESKEIKYSISKNETIVYIPINHDINSELAQNEIRKAIEETWRKEAKEILPNRINYLAKKHGLSYQKVSLSLRCCN